MAAPLSPVHGTLVCCAPRLGTIDSHYRKSRLNLLLQKLLIKWWWNWPCGRREKILAPRRFCSDFLLESVLVWRKLTSSWQLIEMLHCLLYLSLSHTHELLSHTRTHALSHALSHAFLSLYLSSCSKCLDILCSCSPFWSLSPCILFFWIHFRPFFPCFGNVLNKHNKIWIERELVCLDCIWR